MHYSVAYDGERRRYAIGLLLLGQVVLVTIDPLAKWLGMSGLPIGEIIFVRYAGHLAMVLALALPIHGRQLFRTGAIGLELGRGASLVASSLTNFVAVTLLPVALTSSILNTTPLLICLLSIPILGERVALRQWLSIAAGFLGVLIIIRPGTGDFSPAALLSLAGAFLGALYNILTRKLARIDTASTQQVYSAGLAVLCSAPFAFEHWAWPQDGPTWLAFALIGVSGMAGHQIVTVAARFAPASFLAPFTSIQVVYSSIISWLVFQQPPTRWVIAGAVIVILSGAYLAWGERRATPQQVLPVVED